MDTVLKKKRTSAIHSVAARLYAITIIPLIIFSFIIVIVGYSLISRFSYNQIESELRSACATAVLMYDGKYPGDYSLISGDDNSRALYLYKGETNITTDYSLVDELKFATGLEYSLFYQDTRIHTTIMDKYSARCIATGAHEKILQDVLNGKTATFYHNSQIDEVDYCSFYTPLVSSSGDVVGMMGVAKRTSDIQNMIMQVLTPLVLAILILMAFVIVLITRYTREIVSVLDKIHVFMSRASRGDVEAELDPDVTRRPDELGSIGTSILEMHRSLRDMMERDPLTRLFNRRSADRKLSSIYSHTVKERIPFCISIGDIDHFKHVNDTYGHDAGDIVLVTVANTIQDHMKKFGFVARWGGEEFLLVFDRMKLDQSERSLKILLDKIRDLRIPYGDTEIRVTMSFGVSEWRDRLQLEEMIKESDDKLYYAKESGRNRVISHLLEQSTDTSDTAEAGEADEDFLDAVKMLDMESRLAAERDDITDLYKTVSKKEDN